MTSRRQSRSPISLSSRPLLLRPYTRTTFLRLFGVDLIARKVQPQPHRLQHGLQRRQASRSAPQHNQKPQNRTNFYHHAAHSRHHAAPPQGPPPGACSCHRRQECAFERGGVRCGCKRFAAASAEAGRRVQVARRSGACAPQFCAAQHARHTKQQFNCYWEQCPQQSNSHSVQNTHSSSLPSVLNPSPVETPYHIHWRQRSLRCVQGWCQPLPRNVRATAAAAAASHLRLF
jgi:hypothetical protein